MERIAVFIERSGIDHNASVINLIDFLADHFTIDLFLRDVALTRSRVLAKETVRIVEVKKRLTALAIWNQSKGLLKKLGKSYFQRTPVPGLPIRKRWSGRDVKAGFLATQYKCMIAFDPHGFLFCKEIYPQAKPIYYSLELYLKKDPPAPFYLRAAMRRFKKTLARERKLVKDINGLIIQSREREILFRADHLLNEAVPSLILPVTCRGPAVAEKSGHLHERLKLAPEVKIALHLGGMNYWFPCIEMARAISGLDRWVLVFQGNHNREYLNLFRQAMSEEQIKNAIVLDHYYDEMDDLDRVLMSCAIGIAWYNGLSANFLTAGMSSGKISAYLKFGLPVIANRNPSTEEAVEKSGSGICIADMNEMATAITKICREYACFSANARREYETRYRFENYHQPLLKFL